MNYSEFIWRVLWEVGQAMLDEDHQDLLDSFTPEE